MLKGSFFKTGIVSSIAKSDEIMKISHLAFSPEIMGADILEKLSLTTEKSLFVSTKESPHVVPMRYLLKESFSLFYRTGIVSSVAKSDEISKITHLAFSPEIMGADILEKLSLTAEKSLFAWGTAQGTLFNEQNEQLLRILKIDTPPFKYISKEITTRWLPP